MKRLKRQPLKIKSNTIKVIPRPSHKTQGLLHFQGQTYPCALGRSGTTMLKKEGDGATPIGVFPILYGFARFDRLKSYKAQLKIKPINNGQGWCDEKTDRNYNRLIKIPYPTSHETMMREDHLYDICLVLDYNISQRIKGRGSAIFFHQARPNYTPTEGCIALSPHHMRILLPKLTKQTKIIIIR
jgi:L,D-peptidoglycan transpeptidase YkuD (ErfK/YbiS/YcfS/YnhG family)